MRVGSNDFKVWLLRALAIAKKLSLATVVLCAASLSANAQFVGFVGIQTVTSTPFNATACTGSPQVAVVPNLGQTAHYVVISSTLGGAVKEARILGSNDGSNFAVISDTLMGNANSNLPTLVGSGYYTVVEVEVTCPVAATVTVKYSGQSVAQGPVIGDQQVSQYVKMLGIPGSSASLTTQNQVFQTPYGSSASTIYFQFGTSGVAPTGSTVTVACSQSFTNSLPVFNAAVFTIANTTSLQSFPVPANSCPFINLTYTAGAGGSGNTYLLTENFALPGVPSNPAYTYTHITGTGATIAKTTGGFLHTLNVNTGGAGTVSVFDLGGAACVGTPATNIVAVITATATTLQTFTFDASLLNGICVKASVAMDLTVSTQ